MSLKNPFTKEEAERLGEEVGRQAGRWWKENQELFVGLAKDEIKDVFKAMRDGTSIEARIELATMMDREDWVKYRDGLTEELTEIALKRFQLHEALQDLGNRIAKVLGRAAMRLIQF